MALRDDVSCCRVFFVSCCALAVPLARAVVFAVVATVPPVVVFVGAFARWLFEVAALWLNRPVSIHTW